ncbi:MAG: nicotinate (nicotinamide) nucleotide adenylyltransferase [Verrucomicrobia bacterium]|nr:nicotinate (nicotinamide) nucleotide adenylyltransferase [Verrucomicrobiota bacterium]NBT24770.1 nicotinate (nicotinamide) nucleotide adenylyltransferase [bacterium]NBV97270.1 nicotinate (nicotinamide) nucleotide adenylyltransferase [Verrucomicrobiota bacterium]NBY67028.1 nicotinate (nicotinamide) nucleotide adenylyltransferase [Verrucomicrobiota bacterium]
MRRRIGLFGGSFDPFHLGHFLIARLAKEKFRLDEVVYLPCARSPLKSSQPIAPSLERLQWLKTGLAGEKWARVSSWEIMRPGLSYSVDTALCWRLKHPGAQLFWIMGSDQWKVLHQWKDHKKLSRIVHFLVFPRPNPPRPRTAVKMSVLPERFDISSTQIRQRLKQKLSIRGMVPPEIEKRIQVSRFYR